MSFERRRLICLVSITLKMAAFLKFLLIVKKIKRSQLSKLPQSPGVARKKSNTHAKILQGAEIKHALMKPST